MKPNRYEISNGASGASLGIYPGATEAEALDAMAQDAGYNTYTEALAVAPGDEIIITLTT